MTNQNEQQQTQDQSDSIPNFSDLTPEEQEVFLAAWQQNGRDPKELTG